MKKVVTSMIVSCVMALTLAGLSACGSGNAQSANPFQGDDYPDAFELVGMTLSEIEGKFSSCYSGSVDGWGIGYSNDEGLVAAAHGGYSEYYSSTDEGKWLLVVQNEDKPSEEKPRLMYFYFTAHDGDLLSFCKEFESYYGLDEMDLTELEEDPNSSRVDCNIYRNGELVGKFISQRRDGVIHCSLNIKTD